MILANINQKTICLKLVRIFVLPQMFGEEVLPDHVVASVDDHAAEQAREAARSLLDGMALDEVVQPEGRENNFAIARSSTKAQSSQIRAWGLESGTFLSAVVTTVIVEKNFYSQSKLTTHKAKNQFFSQHLTEVF